MGNMEFNLALDGKISQAIFQRNRINLAFNFNFQRAFQVLVSKGETAVEVLLLQINF
jgi:hypothetical protein